MVLSVFYVDDEIDLVEIFDLTFSSEVIEIQGFSDPKQALLAAKDSIPDVIFIDYRMPSINGDRLAQEMPPNVPKYLLTGELDAQPAYPFQGILTKPYNSAEIQKILDDLLTRKKG